MAPVTSPNYAATVTAKCGYPNIGAQQLQSLGNFYVVDIFKDGIFIHNNPIFYLYIINPNQFYIYA